MGHITGTYNMCSLNLRWIQQLHIKIICIATIPSDQPKTSNARMYSDDRAR